MEISQYIFDLVFRGIKSKKADYYIENDIDICFEYFGLKDNKLPNFQTVAESHGVSRQFIEQKISGQIKPFITDDDKDLFNKIALVLNNTICDKLNTFYLKLHEQHDVHGNIHIYGLLNIFKIMGIELSVKIFNFNLKPATKMDFENQDDLLIINNSIAKKLFDYYKIIKTAPGVRGIVNLHEMYNLNLKIPYEIIEYIVIRNEFSWILTINKDTWYLFENRDNVIINTLGKLKNIISAIPLAELAIVIYQVITARTNKVANPSIEIIEKYLSTSKYLNLHNGIIYFGENLEVEKLSTSDEIIIEYFKDRESYESSFIELEPVFLDYGFTRVNATKNCYHSPFILVDKSQGRKNYILNYIMQYQSKIVEIDDRYSLYRKKLIKYYERTDIDSLSKQRTEQILLREYLFEGKSIEKCALCGREYSINSLVTAHKKKRSICSESERIDPNIVWPLCKFGCDYVYEERYIKIVDGQIVLNNLEALTKDELGYCSKIQENTIDVKWINNSEQYFI